MAQRDYVSRGRAPQKKKNKKQAEQASKPSPLQWLRVVIVAGLLIGFAAFLWSIKDAAKTVPDAPVKPTVVQSEDELPELPEEEWEYIRSLPGYEVEIDVSEQEKSDKRYLMQCASFRTRAQADEMRAKIAFQGLEAQIRASNGSNGEWFRVILGPFDTKRDAERAKHTLRKSNITTCQIWYWNN